ncbi:MAG: RsmD family RNA methyltransferase [Planctomycetota bacterium]
MGRRRSTDRSRQDSSFEETAPRPAPTPRGGSEQPTGEVRIIGGSLRGRVLPFLGGDHLRPMKDRVREAVFNLLADNVKGTQVIDLFAGTGVLAFEALSRGATAALLLERHFPTARQMQRRAAEMQLEDRVEVLSSDTFVWAKRFFAGTLANPDGTRRDLLSEWQGRPWLIFCCPPYSLFVTRPDEVIQLVTQLRDRAPPGSLLVVESDERFDPGQLPDADAWVTRVYPPAVIAIWRCRNDS